MIAYQHTYFEQTADRAPHRVAIDDHGATVSYAQLEEYANRLANLLSGQGCGPNERVCVFTGKNFHMYAAVLAALKAGGCWVPLSNAFPHDRLQFLLTTLRPVAVIVDQATLAQTLALRAECEIAFTVVLVDGDAPDDGTVFGDSHIAAQPAHRPKVVGLTPDDLAYIIFTSGSTGTPKGVMVRHRNTCQFLSLCPDFFGIEEGARFAHFSDLTFDPSVFDLFHCWQTGGTLVPFNRRSYRINPALFLKEQRINVLFTVPSVIANIRDSGQLQDSSLGTVKHLLLTGEAVPANLVIDWYGAHPETTIYNMYGTTETAIVSHWCRIPRDQSLDSPVPVGCPLPGMRVRLMDGDKAVAAGEIGESVVCGSQVSPGYWGNAYQTQAAFVVDPLAPELPLLVYRTGDLLREAQNGMHYYVGRVDTQVKVRGHRIELGEIENTLLSNEQVFEAAAVVGQMAGYDDRLVAFVKASKSTKMEELHQYLSPRLPNYMIPSRIVPIFGDMPRNANGKIDRQALQRLAIEVLNDKGTK